MDEKETSIDQAYNSYRAKRTSLRGKALSVIYIVAMRAFILALALVAGAEMFFGALLERELTAPNLSIAYIIGITVTAVMAKGLSYIVFGSKKEKSPRGAANTIESNIE